MVACAERVMGSPHAIEPVGWYLSRTYSEGAQEFGREIMGEIEEWQEKHPSLQPCLAHIGQPSEGPSYLLRGELGRIARDRRVEVHGYQPVEGLPEVREAVAGHLNRRGFYPYSLGPENIVVNVSAKAMVQAITRVAIEKGERVAVFGPGYPGHISSALYASRGNLVRIPIREENNWHPEPEELAEILYDFEPRALIVCDPQNPTGGVLGEDVSEVIANYIEEDRQRLVILDAVYHGFVYEGTYRPLSRDLRISEQVFVVDSASKDLRVPGWRVAYGAFPKSQGEIREAEIQYFNDSPSCAATPLCLAIIPGLSSEGDKLIREMVEGYMMKREQVVVELNSVSGLSCQMPEGAFYVMLNVSETGMRGEEFAHFVAEEAGVTVLPGEYFGTDVFDFQGNSLFPREEAEKYVRFSYGGDLDNLLRGIARMREVLERG